MNIGSLDYRVLIERKVVTPDPDYGTEVVTWGTVDTVWANVEDAPARSSESVTQSVAIAKNQTRLRIRYRADLDSSMRITIYRPAPITYQIIAGPSELGRRRGLELMLERISS